MEIFVRNAAFQAKMLMTINYVVTKKRRENHTTRNKGSIMGHKSHEPCFHVFLKEAEIMNFVGVHSSA